MLHCRSFSPPNSFR